MPNLQESRNRRLNCSGKVAPKSDEVIYSEWGGIRAGENYWLAFDYSYPFVRFHIFTNYLKITFPFGEIILPKGKIQRIQARSKFLGPLAKGRFIFYHEISNTPEYIQYWSYYPRRLEANLKKQGFW